MDFSTHIHELTNKLCEQIHETVTNRTADIRDLTLQKTLKKCAEEHLQKPQKDTTDVHDVDKHFAIICFRERYNGHTKKADRLQELSNSINLTDHFKAISFILNKRRECSTNRSKSSVYSLHTFTNNRLNDELHTTTTNSYSLTTRANFTQTYHAQPYSFGECFKLPELTAHTNPNINYTKFMCSVTSGTYKSVLDRSRATDSIQSHDPTTTTRSDVITDRSTDDKPVQTKYTLESIPELVAYLKKNPKELYEMDAAVLLPFYCHQRELELALLPHEERARHYPLVRVNEKSQLIRKLVDCLLDTPSDVIYFDGNAYVIARGLCCTSITPDTFADFSRQFLTRATVYRRLKMLTNEPTKRFGMIFKKFTIIVTAYLDMYRAAIHAFHFESTLNMIELANNVRSLFELLDTIDVCSDAVKRLSSRVNVPRGTAFLHRINDLLLPAQPNSLAQAALFDFLLGCYDFYLERFFAPWMFEGKLNDPFGEFFIQKESKFIDETSRLYWKAGFRVDKSIGAPPYLLNLTELIYICGRNAHYIQRHNKSNQTAYETFNRTIPLRICTNDRELCVLKSNLRAFYDETITKQNLLDFKKVFAKDARRFVNVRQVATKKRAESVRRIIDEQNRSRELRLIVKRDAQKRIRDDYRDVEREKIACEHAQLTRELELMKWNRLRVKQREIFVANERNNIYDEYEALSKIVTKKIELIDVRKSMLLTGENQTISIDDITNDNVELPSDNLTNNNVVIDQNRTDLSNNNVDGGNTAIIDDGKIDSGTIDTKKIDSRIVNDRKNDTDAKQIDKNAASKLMMNEYADNLTAAKRNRLNVMDNEWFYGCESTVSDSKSFKNESKSIGNESKSIENESKSMKNIAKSTLISSTPPETELQRNRRHVMATTIKQFLGNYADDNANEAKRERLTFSVAWDYSLAKISRSGIACESPEDFYRALLTRVKDEMAGGQVASVGCESVREFLDGFACNACDGYSLLAKFRDQFRDKQIDYEPRPKPHTFWYERHLKPVVQSPPMPLFKTSRIKFLINQSILLPLQTQIRLTNAYILHDVLTCDFVAHLKFLRNVYMFGDGLFATTLTGLTCEKLYAIESKHAFVIDVFNFRFLCDAIAISLGASHLQSTKVMSERLSIFLDDHVDDYAITRDKPSRGLHTSKSTDFKLHLDVTSPLSDLKSPQTDFNLPHSDLKSPSNDLKSPLSDVNPQRSDSNSRRSNVSPQSALAEPLLGTLRHSKSAEFNKTLDYTDLSRDDVGNWRNFKLIVDACSSTIPSVLSLRYRVDWPLNIIITPHVLKIYDGIFKYLLKIRRCWWVLDDVYHGLLNIPKHAQFVTIVVHQSPHYRRVQTIRHIMYMWVYNLYYYETDVIIRSQWKRMKADLLHASGIDDVYTIHLNYLNAIVKRSLLDTNSKVVMKCLHNIFEMILRFHACLNVDMWTLNGNDTFYTHANMKKIELCYRNFRQQATFFLKFLHKRVHYQCELIELIDLLDLNRFYGNW